MRSKQALFETMEKLLLEQESLLADGEFQKLNEKSDEVEKVISEIKNLDYEMAMIESTGEISEVSGTSDRVNRLDNVPDRINDLARRNQTILGKIADNLAEARDKIRLELGETVAMNRIKGYLFHTATAPVFFDQKS